MKSYDELFALITRRGVHAVFGDAGEGFAIEQNPDELARFLVEMQALGVESVLEIGTGYRAGLARFLNDDMGWRVVSVDNKNYGHSFSGIAFIHAYLGFDTASIGQFDLVIIDADHSYVGVKADDDWWRPHATKAVMFHDIAGLRECEGVKQYWDEISRIRTMRKHGYYELIAKGDTRGGIGYIVLAEAAHISNEILELGVQLEDDILSGKVKLDSPPAKKPPVKRKPAAKKKPPARTTAKK